MNLVIKSSILTLLAAAASSVNADNCIDTGINAAQLVILENWCGLGFTASTLNPEERCREVAIRTCQSGSTLRDITNEWGCRQPNNSQIRRLGGYCEYWVDNLIDRRGEASFVATKFDDADSKSSKPPPNYDTTFVSKASKTSKPTRSPTRSPTPDSSVVSGFRAGQQAMQQWWKNEGSTCSNAWSGIINPAANEIKNSQFPNKGSSNTRTCNQRARLGVDSEVRAIQDECFSANDMSMAEADEASFVATDSSLQARVCKMPGCRCSWESGNCLCVCPKPNELNLEMSRRALRGHNN